MKLLFAIRNTTTGKYYSPNLDGKTQWAGHERAYTYESYDLAAECSCRIEEDDFEIVEYVPRPHIPMWETLGCTKEDLEKSIRNFVEYVEE